VSPRPTLPPSASQSLAADPRRVGSRIRVRTWETRRCQNGLKWQVVDGVAPLVWLGGLGDQLQVRNPLANGCAQLMTVEQTTKVFSLTLPVLCHDTETDILREDDAALPRGQFK